jgi:hypothetical protein
MCFPNNMNLVDLNAINIIISMFTLGNTYVNTLKISSDDLILTFTV